MAQITIDEAFLTKLESKYQGVDDDTNNRSGPFQWEHKNTKVRGNITAALPVNVGAEPFKPGSDLKSAVETVRSNLADRVKQFGQHIYQLHWGVQYLLDDTDGTEQLNTMKAQQFQSYLPTGTGGGGGSTPPPTTT